jgi:hypothetical protein
LVKKDVEWIYANYPTRSADGKPMFLAREVENFIFGPYPDSNYTIKGTYYKRLTALSSTNTNNWLTDTYPDLILFAALCEASPYLGNDARIPIWEKKYAQIKDQIALNDINEEFNGSPLSATMR